MTKLNTVALVGIFGILGLAAAIFAANRAADNITIDDKDPA